MEKGGKAEVQTRYKLADTLLESGSYDDATDEYVWLWQNIPTQDPPMRGFRSSFMAKKMALLAERHSAARTRFIKLRAAAEQLADRFDWLILNEVLGEEQETLDWFDEIKNHPDSTEKLEHVAYRLERLLIKHNRWADITNFLYKDPLQKLRDQQEQLQMYKGMTMAKEQKNVPDYDPFVKSAGVLYASLLAAGQRQTADELADESIKLSDSLKLRIELLRSAFQAGLFTPDQLKIIDEAKPASSKDATFYQMRMTMYYALKQREQALKDCDQLIAINGNNSDLYVVRAGIFMALKDNGRALKDLNRAIQLNSKSASALATRGFAYCKMNDVEAALEDVEHAIQSDPKFPWSYIVKSVANYNQKKFQEAYDAATKAIELDPKSPGGFGRRGKAAYKLERYDEALADLTKWTIDIDDAGEAFFYRALAYEKLGKVDLAAADQTEAEKLGFKPEEGE